MLRGLLFFHRDPCALLVHSSILTLFSTHPRLPGSPPPCHFWLTHVSCWRTQSKKRFWSTRLSWGWWRCTRTLWSRQPPGRKRGPWASCAGNLCCPFRTAQTLLTWSTRACRSWRSPELSCLWRWKTSSTAGPRRSREKDQNIPLPVWKRALWTAELSCLKQKKWKYFCKFLQDDIKDGVKGVWNISYAYYRLYR